LLGACPYPWNKVFRRDFIERHGLTFASTPVQNDVSFVMAALLKASAIRILPWTLYRYTEQRPEPGQLGRIRDERRLAVREVFDACDALLTAEQAAPDQWKYYLAYEFDSLIWNMSLVDSELIRTIREYAVREARRRPSEILERILSEGLLPPECRAMFLSFLPCQPAGLRISVIRREQAEQAARLDRMLAVAATIRRYLTRPEYTPLRAVFMRLFIRDWAALPSEAQARYGRGIPQVFPPLARADYRLCTRLFPDARISDALYVLFMSRSRPRLARLARRTAAFILPRVIRPWRRCKAAVMRRLGR
jgi:hypothetical protein